jgi:hydroxymethylglutaryl-CoA lyase
MLSIFPSLANHYVPLLSSTHSSIPSLYFAFYPAGQALANIHAALECGIATVDSSVGGLGGCPYGTYCSAFLSV